MSIEECVCVRLGINDRGTVTHFSRDHLRFRSVLYKRRGGEGGGEEGGQGEERGEERGSVRGKGTGGVERGAGG